MKRIYTLVILLHVIACGKMVARTSYEYARDNDIVYKCEIGTYKATVVNFCTKSEEVTIPSHIMYDGDIYTVAGISYNGFVTSYSDAQSEALGESMLAGLLGLDMLATMGMTASLDEVEVNRKTLKRLGLSVDFNFERVRRRIKFINIPNTVKTIGRKAFAGMPRLQTCTIPEDVELSQDCFGNNERLRFLTLSGMPRQYVRNSLFGKHTITPEDPNYLQELASYLGLSEYTILRYPKWDEWREEQKRVFINKYQTEVQNANNDIYKALRSHNCQWRDYPYNRRVPFDSIAPVQIPYTNPTINNEKDYEKCFRELCDLKEDILTKLSQELQHKKDSAYNVYTQNPDEFIEAYGKKHPECVSYSDSLYNEYRCLTTRAHVFSCVIEFKTIPHRQWVPCRKSQYQTYADIYASQEEFNQWYDLGEEVLTNDIEQRETLQQLSIFMEKTGSKINLRKPSIERSELEELYLSKLKDTPYYESALDMLYSNKRFSKEWQKNGHLFSSVEAFYIAYTDAEYRQIVRDKRRKI